MPAELEHIREAVKRNNPGMSESQSWAIATAAWKHKHGKKTKAEMRKEAARSAYALRGFSPKYLMLAAPVIGGVGGYALAAKYKHKWVKEHAAPIAIGATTAGLGAAALTGHIAGIKAAPGVESPAFDAEKLQVAADDIIDAYNEYRMIAGSSGQHDKVARMELEKLTPLADDAYLAYMRWRKQERETGQGPQQPQVPTPALRKEAGVDPRIVQQLVDAYMAADFSPMVNYAKVALPHIQAKAKALPLAEKLLRKNAIKGVLNSEHFRKNTRPG